MGIFVEMKYDLRWSQFSGGVWSSLTLLEPQSRSGDKPVKFQVVLSPNGTAVLKGLSEELQKV